MTMDEGRIRLEKMLDHVDVEGIARCPGLLKMKEAVDELVSGKAGRASWEAHENLSLQAAEGTKKTMALILMDPLSQTGSGQEGRVCRKWMLAALDVESLDADG